jgi:hypothetical protein
MSTTTQAPQDFVLIDVRPVWPDIWEVRCYSFTEEIRFDDIGNVSNSSSCKKRWFRDFATNIIPPDSHGVVPERFWCFARERLRERGYKRYAYMGEGLSGESDKYGHEEL